MLIDALTAASCLHHTMQPELLAALSAACQGNQVEVEAVAGLDETPHYLGSILQGSSPCQHCSIATETTRPLDYPREGWGNPLGLE